MAPRSARARAACARSSSTPPGSRSRSSRRSATARASASRIAYSREGRDHGGALETAGGIAKALPLLGDAFWIVSADVWAPDFRFERRRRGALRRERLRWRTSGWCRTRAFIRAATSASTPTALASPKAPAPTASAGPTPTSRSRVPRCSPASRPERTPRSRRCSTPACASAAIGAEIYRGRWENVGTPEQLAALNAAPV